MKVVVTGHGCPVSMTHVEMDRDDVPASSVKQSRQSDDSWFTHWHENDLGWNQETLASLSAYDRLLQEREGRV